MTIFAKFIQDSETHLIEDIDANGYLVNHEDTENELQSEGNIDVNVEFNEDDFNAENIMGKVFDKLDDVYTFYNRYAFLHGFGIRIHWEHKNKITNEPYRKMYMCNKEGFKKLKVDRSGVDTKKRRRNLRTGCEAVLRVSKMKDGKWVVDQFNDIHNHELTMTPTKVMKHHSHGKFYRSMECKSLMVKLGQSGLRPSQNQTKPSFAAFSHGKNSATVFLSKTFKTKPSFANSAVTNWLKTFKQLLVPNSAVTKILLPKLLKPNQVLQQFF